MKQLKSIILFLIAASFPVAGQENNGDPAQEKVYLHTDKASYIAGSHLYYKLYFQGDPLKLGYYIQDRRIWQ